VVTLFGNLWNKEEKYILVDTKTKITRIILLKKQLRQCFYLTTTSTTFRWGTTHPSGEEYSP
jgi:hypothetical protein